MQKKHLETITPNSATSKIVTNGQIIEIRHIAQARQHLFELPNTLVLFDIDNTLMRPQNGPIGTSEWFASLIKYGVANGLSEPASSALVSEVYTKIQDRVIYGAVEPEVINLVAELQAQHIATVALTARPDFLHEITTKLLNSIGINFNNGTSYDPHAFSTIPGTLLADGILFCNSNKAETLACFLALKHLFPARIVLIDDELRYLQALEVALAQENIEFIGLHYTFVSAKMPLFVLEENMIPQSFLDAIGHEQVETAQAQP